MSLSQTAEKLRQNSPAILCKNAAHQGRPVGEGLHKQVGHAAAGTHGLIPCAVPNPPDAGIEDRAWGASQMVGQNA